MTQPWKGVFHFCMHYSLSPLDGTFYWVCHHTAKLESLWNTKHFWGVETSLFWFCKEDYWFAKLYQKLCQHDTRPPAAPIHDPIASPYLTRPSQWQVKRSGADWVFACWKMAPKYFRAGWWFLSASPSNPSGGGDICLMSDREEAHITLDYLVCLCMSRFYFICSVK